MRTNATGDCADNRMLAVLDLLLSKEFQTKCSWTGVGRKGPKIAIMPNRNILQLFQFIGTDDTEIVTQQKLASFFMKKLKNSLKRMMVHGRRRGTRHVRKHRKPEEERTGDEADPNPIDSSNAPNGQDDEDDNGHIEPGVNETVESCVDSSDAQEYANFLSESSGADDSSD